MEKVWIKSIFLFLFNKRQKQHNFLISKTFHVYSSQKKKNLLTKTAKSTESFLLLLILHCSRKKLRLVEISRDKDTIQSL